MSSDIGSLRGPPRFTEQEDELLISLVIPSPSLYDPEDARFKNREAKAAVWFAISNIVKRDVESCRRRWKDIKNNYFKIRRQNKSDRCKWSLYEKLSFLDPVYERVGEAVLSPNTEERDALSSLQIVWDKSASESSSRVEGTSCKMDTQPSGSGDATVRKRRFEEVSSDEEDSRDRYNPPPGHDDVDLFMRSIAVQMKKMSQRKIAQAKVRILTIVNELQFGQLRMGEP